MGAAIGFAIGGWSAASGAPVGGVITGGQGTISHPDPKTTTVRQRSGRLAIDWQRFDVGAGESVRFVQPSAQAAALNRIRDQRPSKIFGALRANGRVFLINPNGVVFGPTAKVKVGSLVASTLDLRSEDFMRGEHALHAVPGTQGRVLNQGMIEAASGGSVTLVGSSVENQGTIVAHLGQVTLAAGTKATLDFDGDGLVRVQVDAPHADHSEEAPDSGQIRDELSAHRGQVVLSAGASRAVFDRALNTDGIQRAGRIEARGGRVRLLGIGAPVHVGGTVDVSAASETGTTTAPIGAGRAGQIEVRGTDAVTVAGELRADGPRGGGHIEVRGEATTIVQDSTLTARASAGVGGEVVLSGDEVAVLGASRLDASGAEGGGHVRIGGSPRPSDGSGDSAPSTSARASVIGPQVRLAADATRAGDGGEIVVWSEEVSRFAGHASARGGPQGGDGGLVETSARHYLEVRGRADVAAPGGGRAGTWLLDPTNIELRQVATTLGDDSSGGSFDALDPNLFSAGNLGPAVADIDQIVASLEAGSSVTIQTASGTDPDDAGDITVVDPIAVTLGAGDVSLRLEADDGITVDGAITAGGADRLALVLSAGADIRVNAGLTTNGGDLDLATTGGSIALANVADVLDAGAGNVSLSARAGDITSAGAAVDIRAAGHVSLAARAIGAGSRLDLVDATALTVLDTGAGDIAIGEVIASTIGTTTLTVADMTSGAIDIAYVGGDAVAVASGHVLGSTTLDHTFSYTATDGAITQSGALTLGASAHFATSGDDQGITLSAGGNHLQGTVSFNTVTGGAHGGSVVLDNGANPLALGASTIAGPLSVAAGGLTLHGDVIASGQDYSSAGPVTLDAGTLVLLDASAWPGAVTFGTHDVNANGDDSNGLRILATGTDAITLSEVGTGPGGRLDTLTLTTGAGGTISVEDVTTSGAQTYTAGAGGSVALGGSYQATGGAGAAPITFDAGVSVVGTTLVLTAGGVGDDITFLGRVDSEAGEHNPLTLAAGTLGDISFAGALGSAAPDSALGALHISGANDISIGADLVAGALVINNLGALSLGGGTLAIDGLSADGVLPDPDVLGTGLDLGGVAGTIFLAGDVLMDTTRAGVAGLDVELSGGTLDGGGNTLSIDAGTGGVVTIGAVDDAGLTFVNAATVSALGPIGATSARPLVVQGVSDGGTVTFHDNVSVSSLAVADNGLSYDVRLLGAVNQVTTGPSVFTHRGRLQLGDEVSDASTFVGGLQTTGNSSNPSAVDVVGTLASADAALTLGPIYLIGDLTLDAGTGALSLGSVAASAAHTLTITASASAHFTDSVALAGDLVQANPASGPTTFDGAVTVDNGTLRGTDFVMRAGWVSSGALVIENTGAVVKEASGNIDAAGGFSTTGALVLAADVLTTGTDLTVGGNLTLSQASDLILSTGPGAGSIDIVGATNGTSGGSAEQLTVSAGAGNLTFTGQVGDGATDTLARLDVTADNRQVVFAAGVDLQTLALAPGSYALALNGPSTVADSLDFATTGTVTLGDDGDVIQFRDGAVHLSGPTRLGGVIDTGGSDLELAETSLVFPTSVTTAGGSFDVETALDLGAHALTVQTGGGEISIGGAITTSGGALTLDAGTGAEAEIELVSFDDGDANTADLIIVESQGTRITGTVRARHLDIQDTATAVVVDGAVDVGSLSTGPAGFGLTLLSDTTVLADTTFANTGVLRFGDAASDGFTFLGGLDTRSATRLDLAGEVFTGGADLDLGATQLLSAAGVAADEVGIHGPVVGTSSFYISQVNGVPLVLNATSESSGVLDLTAAELARLATGPLTLGSNGADVTIDSPAGNAFIIDQSTTVVGGDVDVNAGTTRIGVTGQALNLRINTLNAGPDDIVFFGNGRVVFERGGGTRVFTTHPDATIDFPELVVNRDLTIESDHVQVDRALGTASARLALLPMTAGLDIVLGSGDFLVPASAATFAGFTGELSVGGTVSEDASDIEASAGSVLVDRTLEVGGAGSRLSVVSLADVVVDQSTTPTPGQLAVDDLLTVVALGLVPGSNGDITDTARTPAAFQADRAIFLASGAIGSESGPVTLDVGELAAGAASGADPQFDVAPGASAPATSADLDQVRDAFASAFNASSQFAGSRLFGNLSTNVKVDTSNQSGRETTLGDLGFLDESVFREFTLFAVEVGILVPWYADENFPTLPHPDDYLDVDGNLDAVAWEAAVEAFMLEVERKLVSDGLASDQRARIRAEVRAYLAQRVLRAGQRGNPALTLSALGVTR